MIELYNDDCLSIMDKFIDKQRKTDLIITSPPYNMNLRVHSGKYISRWGWKGNVDAFSTKYDNYSDDLSMEEYFEFQKKFIDKCLQISNLTFYNIQMITGNKIALFKLLGYFADKIKEIIIWDKILSQPAMKYNTLNSQFEFIFVFSNEKPYNRMFDKANFERGTESNLWSIKREINKNHKAAFPKELIRKIVKDFSKEGDVIFDPFMGSGTTGVVCKEMKRSFIGVEIDKNYFDIAENNINNQEFIF
ncbi:MAG: site-specific DNA-methyltransferase [Alphaproteobacteria bacterium]|nr:site-specific DNA-methyltransferase [Alphaproteobacteria bacterium]